MTTNLIRHLAVLARMCLSDGIPRRSLAVALIVGTILNLINYRLGSRDRR